MTLEALSAARQSSDIQLTLYPVPSNVYTVSLLISCLNVICDVKVHSKGNFNHLSQFELASCLFLPMHFEEILKEQILTLMLVCFFIDAHK